MSLPASSSSLISKVIRSGCLQNSSEGTTDNPTKTSKIKLIATIAFYQQYLTHMLTVVLFVVVYVHYSSDFEFFHARLAKIGCTAVISSPILATF